MVELLWIENLLISGDLSQIIPEGWLLYIAKQYSEGFVRYQRGDGTAISA
jgi:hypothetical protein